MDSKLAKSLVDLIDETLAELDELKKSDRFSAAEVKLGDSKSGMKEADKNGKLGKEEDEDEDKEEAAKAEEDGEEDDMSKEEDMPEGTMAKEEDEEEEDDEDEEEEEAKKVEDCEDKPMKKSEEPKLESLMKSYVDQRIDPIESKINSLFELVQELADAPVQAKSASFKDLKPLQKSEPEVQPLAKSDIVNKLFDLKKSGEKVDTLDIASAELAGPSELAKIAHKYGIK